MLPLTTTESGIVRGYWQHWFVIGRQVTIVEFYGQTIFGRPLLAMELARNFTQFLYIQLLRQLALFGDLDEKSKQCATAGGITDIEWLQSLAEEAGDDLGALLKHAAFSNNPPQSCFEDVAAYPGDFPHSRMKVSSEALRRVCGYEVHSRFAEGRADPNYRQYVASLEIAPPWLKTMSQPQVFAELLGSGDLAGAWLSLNSIGWSFREARNALLALAERAKDPKFNMLAEVWVSLPHERRMGESY
jgi:hypothetical protein